MRLRDLTANNQNVVRRGLASIRSSIRKRVPRTILYILSTVLILVLGSRIPALFVGASTEELLPSSINEENTWEGATVETLSNGDLEYIETQDDSVLLAVTMGNPTECEEEISKVTAYVNSYSSDPEAQIALAIKDDSSTGVE